MSKKYLTSCSDCKHQMSGFDGGFFGLPFTCECRIFGETENRKECRRFEKRMTKSDLFERIRLLEKENKELKEENKQLKEEIKHYWGYKNRKKQKIKDLEKQLNHIQNLIYKDKMKRLENE